MRYVVIFQYLKVYETCFCFQEQSWKVFVRVMVILPSHFYRQRAVQTSYALILGSAAL